MQPLAGERFPRLFTSTEDSEFARLDVAASEAVSGEEDLSDPSWTVVRSTHMLPPTPRCPYRVPSMFKRHEAEKQRRYYEVRARDVDSAGKTMGTHMGMLVEHASLAPIVFSAAGGCGKAAAVMMKHFSVVMTSMRCRISSVRIVNTVSSNL